MTQAYQDENTAGDAAIVVLIQPHVATTEPVVTAHHLREVALSETSNKPACCCTVF